MALLRAWMDRRRRVRRDRGATIPEYALMLSAFAVISLGAMEVLQDNAEDEMTVTADCIGKLPSESAPECEVTTTTTSTLDPLLDTDLDGINNGSDNCPNDPNADQTDTDVDGVGDVCDGTPTGDTDNDNIDNATDNCPATPNEDQANSDGDANGDACDVCDGFDDAADGDGDTVPDGCDNCPSVANGDQADSDGDGQGDACEVVELIHVTMSPQTTTEPATWCSGDSNSATTWCSRVVFTATNTGTSLPVGGVTIQATIERYAGSTLMSTTTSSCTTSAAGTCTSTAIRGRYTHTLHVWTVTTVTGGSIPWDAIETTANVTRP